MSYLRKIIDKGQRPISLLGVKFDARQFSVTWRSTTGQIAVVIDPESPKRGHVYFNRYSLLGERLRKNDEFERLYIGKAVCKLLAVEIDLSWVGV